MNNENQENIANDNYEDYNVTSGFESSSSSNFSENEVGLENVTGAKAGLKNVKAKTPSKKVKTMKV